MIDDILAKVELHAHRARQAKKEIDSWRLIEGESVFEDFEKVKTIDTFIYRFTKLQDMMGEKLFKIFLDELGEYRDNMSLLDVLDKLEKLEIVESSQNWMEYRKLRNKLAHEYPNNEAEVVEGIKTALEVFLQIEKILENIKLYKMARNLSQKSDVTR